MILVSLGMMLAGAAEASVAGVYSNVRVNDTNGDTRGMRVEVHEASVSVTDCEKQCGTPVTAAARIDGMRISFTVDMGRGTVTRYAGEFRDDGALVLKVAGRPWNAQVLRREGEARAADMPAPGMVIVPSLAGMELAAPQKKPAGFIRVVAREDAGAARFGGFYSNILYREGAEATEGMAIDYRPGAVPSVTVHDCERYCENVQSVPVRVRGNRIAFTLLEDLGGMPAKGRRFVGVFRADGTLKVWGEGYAKSAQVLRLKPKQ